MAYTQNIVNSANPFPFDNNLYIALPTRGVFGLGDTVQCGVISVWLYGFNSAVSLSIYDDSNPHNLLYFLAQNNGSTLSTVFQAFNDVLGVGNALIDGQANLADPPCAVNILISWDTLNGLYQTYVNNVLVPFTTPPSPIKSTGLVSYGPTVDSVFGAHGVGTPVFGYYADLWMGSRPSFVDLSNPGNRAKFINQTTGKPVDLGADGSLPFGTGPQVYLTVQGSDPASTFLVNAGTGGGTYSDRSIYGSFVDSTGTVALNGNPCLPSPPNPLGCGEPHSVSEITPMWEAVDGATSYNLQYRNALLAGAWTEIDGITDTQYTITGLLPGTQYEWQVDAIIGDSGDTGFGPSGFCSTDPSPFLFLSCENGWTVTAPVTKMWGFDHLIGMTVVGLADGVQLAPQTVAADGSITIPFPASNVKLGLPFAAQLQLPYLDAGNPTIQGRRKVVTAVTVRVDASNGVQLGSNQTDGSTLKPQAIAPPWTHMENVPIQQPPSADPQPLTYTSPGGQTVNFLQTGDLRQVITAQWLKPGQVAIQQTNPLPLTVLSAMPELLEGDVTEQGFAQEQKPQQHTDQRRQHQGPGAWMLRK